MDLERRRKDRRATDRYAHLLEKPDVKVLTLAASLLELSVERRVAIEMYVENQHNLMRIAQLSGK